MRGIQSLKLFWIRTIWWYSTVNVQKPCFLWWKDCFNLWLLCYTYSNHSTFVIMEGKPDVSSTKNALMLFCWISVLTFLCTLWITASGFGSTCGWVNDQFHFWLTLLMTQGIMHLSFFDHLSLSSSSSSVRCHICPCITCSSHRMFKWGQNRSRFNDVRFFSLKTRGDRWVYTLVFDGISRFDTLMRITEDLFGLCLLCQFNCKTSTFGLFNKALTL